MTLPYIGRREPYTAIGVRRVPCARCGKPSHASWQACANGRRHVGVCKDCDIALNELALEFFRVPKRKALMRAYRRKMAEGAGC